MVDRRGAIAEHDRAHLEESETKKPARQRREAEEAERARQQLNAQRSEDWQIWFRQSLYAELTKPDGNPLIDGMGDVIATERAARQKEVKTAVEEQQRVYDAKLAALEQRQRQAQQEQTANDQASWEKFYGEVLAAERAARQTELTAAVEEQQRVYDAKLAALEQRQRQVQQEEAANNQAAWEKFYGEVLATERAARQKEVNAAIEGAQRAVDAKLEALEQRIVQHIERHTDQCNHGIVVSAGRTETLGKMIETERTDRQKEIKATVEEAQRAFETKLAPLEQCIIQHSDQRIMQHIEQCSGRTRALSEVIATERAARQKEVQHVVEEQQRKYDAKLEQLEQRLKSMPGKLPVAKAWQPESVTYQAEYRTHEGALWQARKDTAQTPGAADWVCVARAGRDAITPNVRGTFSADETYKQLDIVVSDGAAFIARHDSPGICPGDGWQLLSRQGRAGRRGETGERGVRGERGVKGEPGPSIVSWQIDRERYQASPLMSDGTVGPTLELRPLFETFLLETTS